MVMFPPKEIIPTVSSTRLTIFLMDVGAAWGGGYLSVDIGKGVKLAESGGLFT